MASHDPRQAADEHTDSHDDAVSSIYATPQSVFAIPRTVPLSSETSNTTPQGVSNAAQSSHASTTTQRNALTVVQSPSVPQESSTASQISISNAWRKCNILSLDGGGIRGYWTLLVLQYLMELIGIEEGRKTLEGDVPEAYREEEDADPIKVAHSFSPEAFPANVSQCVRPPIPRTEIEHDIHKSLQQLKKSQRFLPCHYFDLICGSSTGALIAIMLGRFRMTVDDCIDEYKALGNKIFGHPRRLCKINIPFIPRYKYSAETAEKVFKQVVHRRSELSENPTNEDSLLPSVRGLCKTFVTTQREVNSITDPVHLLRSYDHEKRREANGVNGHGAPLQRRTETGISFSRVTGQPKRIQPLDTRKNYNLADKVAVWKAARCATAAPFYFEPMRMPERSGDKGKDVQYTDGGFSEINNPTHEGILEMRELYGDDAVEVVVSIGTARFDGRRTGMLREVHQAFDTSTSTETVAQRVSQLSREEPNGFEYYRFNHVQGLEGIGMDSWEPRGMGVSKKDAGQRTLTYIRNRFLEWKSHENREEAFRSCAAELVEMRRRRTRDKSRWQHFATGASFRCRERGCPHVNTFHEKDEFSRHLQGQHHIHRGTTDFRESINVAKAEWEYRPRS